MMQTVCCAAESVKASRQYQHVSEHKQCRLTRPIKEVVKIACVTWSLSVQFERQLRV